MKIVAIAHLITLLTLFTGATATAGGTPDSETPATEEICNPLKSATKGLYGLCIAYCEAHDAPGDLTSAEAIMALKPQNAKILANYNKRKTATDPDMPCVVYHEESNCPAWTREQRDLVGMHGYPTIYEDYTIINSATDSVFLDSEMGEFINEEGQSQVGLNLIAVQKFTSDTGQFENASLIYIHAIYHQDGSTEYDAFNTIQTSDEAIYDQCYNDILDHQMP